MHSFWLFHCSVFRRRYPANQTMSARVFGTLRCTTSSSFSRSLNHTKRWRIGEVIVFQNRLQKTVSVSDSDSLFHRLVFRRVSPSCPCAFSDQNHYIQILAHLSFSTSFVSFKSMSRFSVAVTLKSVHKSVYRKSRCHVLQFSCPKFSYPSLPQFLV
jgi:hypothetical protein